MNGTRIRAAVALTCIAALAAPGSAMAGGKAKRSKSAKPKVTKVKKPAKAQAPQVTIRLRHDYLAGGNGAGALVPQPGVRVNLGIDLVGLTAAIPNSILTQLGLPANPVGQLPTLPPLPLY
jgi:hypothetical protein